MNAQETTIKLNYDDFKMLVCMFAGLMSMNGTEKFGYMYVGSFPPGSKDKIMHFLDQFQDMMVRWLDANGTEEDKKMFKELLDKANESKPKRK